MRSELQSVLAAAKTLPPEELPRLIGDLEEVRATALARLTAPIARQAEPELLDVQAAAHRLGSSPGYLYRHHRQLPFTRHLGRKLLFSAQGIENYIRQQHVLTPRRKHAILTSVATPSGGTYEISPGQTRH